MYALFAWIIINTTNIIIPRIIHFLFSYLKITQNIFGVMA